ncbi:MAG TPA: biotin/lipoyl-binding protein, partial [Saprospiraceae bacterium]|nr:biotin/lipoyl-binding protein [Saprospiraceae bacterium]
TISRSTSTDTVPVKSPLPGTVTAVLVAPGAVVNKGDTLLKIEAMKMENNIHAEKPGKVVSVRIKPGDAVLQNDVLIEMEAS